MREPLEAVDFAYVVSDIPPGVSIREWRAQHAVRAVTARRARRAHRRRLWRTVLVPSMLAHAVARLSARHRRTAGRPTDRELPA